MHCLLSMTRFTSQPPVIIAPWTNESEYYNDGLSGVVIFQVVLNLAKHCPDPAIPGDWRAHRKQEPSLFTSRRCSTSRDRVQHIRRHLHHPAFSAGVGSLSSQHPGASSKTPAKYRYGPVYLFCDGHFAGRRRSRNTGSLDIRGVNRMIRPPVTSTVTPTVPRTTYSVSSSMVIMSSPVPATPRRRPGSHPWHLPLLTSDEH